MQFWAVVFAIFSKHIFTRVRFFAPDTAFAEARKHLPEILQKRGINPSAAVAVLDEMLALIGCIDAEIYGPFETTAHERLQKRDEEDWPVLATALALECPIWTEDADFFGAGVATWTTDRVMLLLRELQSDPGESDAQYPWARRAAWPHAFTEACRSPVLNGVTRSDPAVAGIQPARRDGMCGGGVGKAG